ncbi:ATP synthase F0 subunit B [Candidatus Binatia bacterium]|jgi:F-type H+-transporting ATPase subunit b|nr:ATP synthase F0 subunit B [Candidatus Binatia bacterium]
MRKPYPSSWVVPTATLIVLAWSALSFASEGGGGEGHREPTWTLTILGFVNFAIYAFVMYRFAWPAVVKYLKERRASVVSALEAAARAHAEAEALKAEFQAKLANVEADAARARDELLEIARNEADHLLAEAKRSADRIRRDAQLVADQEVARARRTLQEDAAQLIAKIAGELVSQKLTGDDQTRFVQSFIAETRAAKNDGKLTGANS